MSKDWGPYLKVYDDSKDEHCGDQVHEVGQVLSVEGFPQSSHFVRPSGQKMEESDDGSLEFCAWERKTQRNKLHRRGPQRWHFLRRCRSVTSSRVDGGGAEGLPHDGLADVGGDEQRDP